MGLRESTRKRLEAEGFDPSGFQSGEDFIKKVERRIKQLEEERKAKEAKNGNNSVSKGGR